MYSDLFIKVIKTIDNVIDKIFVEPLDKIITKYGIQNVLGIISLITFIMIILIIGTNIIDKVNTSICQKYFECMRNVGYNSNDIAYMNRCYDLFGYDKGLDCKNITAHTFNHINPDYNPYPHIDHYHLEYDINTISD